MSLPRGWWLIALLPLATAVAQPELPTVSSVTVVEAVDVTLQGYVTGPAPVTVRWRRDGATVATGIATTGLASYTIPTAQRNVPATYLLEVSAGGYTVASPAAVVAVAPVTAPQIIGQNTGVRNPSPATPGIRYLLFVRVTGTAPYTYRWQRDGTDVRTTATASNTDNLPVDGLADGTYTVQVSNAAGSVTSQPMRVTQGDANAPLYLTTGPNSAGVRYGDSATLSVIAHATRDPVAWQWRKNGAAIPGATNAGLNFDSFQPSDAGKYSVVLTSPDGTVTSDEATLTLIGRGVGPPVITTAPASQSLHNGDSVTLGVVADAGYGASFQWSKDGAALAGQTSTGLFLPNVTSADAGSYQVDVTNRFGTTRSPAALVSVATGTPPPLAPISLSAGPTTVRANIGETVTLTARVTGTPAPTYQWYRDGNAVAGATDATLSLHDLQPALAGTYAVIATNASGSLYVVVGYVSLASTDVAPRFLTSVPDAWSVPYEGSLTLTVPVSGSPSPSLQWYKDGRPLAFGAGTPYTAAPSGNLAILQIGNPAYLATTYPWATDGAGWDAAGTYTVTATNGLGSTTSRPIRVTVRPPDVAGVYFSRADTSTTGSETGTAILVRPDRSAVLISTGGRRQFTPSMVTPLSLQPNGGFSATYAPPSGGSSTTLTGQAQADTIRLNDALGAVAMNRSTDGPAAPIAGYWTGTLTGGQSGTVHALVSAAGDAVVFIQPQSGSNVSVRSTVDAAFVMHEPAGRAVYLTFEVRFNPDNTFAGNVLTSFGVSLAFTGTRTGPAPQASLANLSSRAQTSAGADALVAGFVVSGRTAQPVLLRASGPALTGFGVGGAMADPLLELYQDGAVIASNDNWGTGGSAVLDAGTRVGAFPFGAGSKDAALLTTLAPGQYSARITPAGSSSAGVTLVEVYDASTASPRTDGPRLINLSTRGAVGAGEAVLVAGFVVSGTQSKRVLVRAIGPTLASFGVTGTLDDPRLRIYGAEGVWAENNDWGGNGPLAALMKTVGAFDLPAGSKDAVISMVLPPGNYSAEVSSATSATGAALVEVYEVADAALPP